MTCKSYVVFLFPWSCNHAWESFYQEDVSVHQIRCVKAPPPYKDQWGAKSRFAHVNTFLHCPEILARPFLDLSQELVADMFDMYSDASRNPGLGSGQPAIHLGCLDSGNRALSKNMIQVLSIWNYLV